MARNTLYPPSVKPGIPKLGSRPKGWFETTFGNVLQVVQRPANVEDNTEYQLVTAKRGRGGIAPREILTGKEILTKIQYYIAKDDFLISKRQIIHGACGIVPAFLDGALVSGEYSVLRVKDGLLLKYLDYFSHSDYFQMTCFQSSVGVDVEKMIFDLKFWLQFKVYLPTLPEQQKIIKILGTWDEAITKTEKLIYTMQEHHRGLAQRLLSGAMRFPEFTSEWRAVKQGDVVTFINGRAYKKSEWEQQGTPVIRLQNLTGSGTEYYYSTLNLAEDKYVKQGDLLYMWSATFGPRIWHGQKAIYHYHIWKIECSNEIDKMFFYYLLGYLTDSWMSQSHGMGMLHITKETMENFFIRIPNIVEQKKIAGVLQASEKKIELQTKKLKLYKQQKKGLMQKLLTGQIRVKV